ncbi:MAG: hypothetical protein OXF61_10740 [Acidimicrobiaceae bacterium]|nr:hypothetical protein [Acidimicrobiaceae bacterium]
MKKHNPWAKWERFSSYSRGDIEKARRSTPKRRRRQRIWIGTAIASIWLTSIVGDFIGHDYDSRLALLVELIIPNPFAGLVIAYFVGAAALAKKSKLTDDEARALADEAEEQQRAGREFAKWLWTGKEPSPDDKKPDSCHE